MKTIKTSLFYSLILFFAIPLSSQESFKSNKINRLWETPLGLKIPESSHYNKYDNTIYVSNIAERPAVKGAGYISKLNIKGKIITEKWFIGLTSPKGIACSSNFLYVTDLNRVIEVNLKSGKLNKEYKNSIAKDLNDVTISEDGVVFVSTTSGSCVYLVGKDSLEVFVESNQLKNMNGILAKENMLYTGSKGNLVSIDRKTKEIKVIAEQVGYVDGLEKISENKFIISDWKGNVQLVQIGKGVEKLLDTTPVKINAADIGYIAAKKILLVPTFLDNKVVAYKLKL